MGGNIEDNGAYSFISEQLLSKDETYENMSQYDQQSADGLEKLSCSTIGQSSFSSYQKTSQQFTSKTSSTEQIEKSIENKVKGRQKESDSQNQEESSTHGVFSHDGSIQRGDNYFDSTSEESIQFSLEGNPMVTHLSKCHDDQACLDQKCTLTSKDEISKITSKYINNEKNQNQIEEGTRVRQQNINELRRQGKEILQNVKFRSYHTKALEIIMYCKGITNFKCEDARNLWFNQLDSEIRFKFNKGIIDAHKQKIRRLILKQEGYVPNWVESGSNMRNWMYQKNSKNAKIISQICEKWQDPNFQGFSDEEILALLLKYVPFH